MITRTREAAAVAAAPLPRVNLLPPEITEAARFRRVQAGLGLGVVAVVGLVGALYVSAAASVSAADDELQTATAQSGELQRQIAGYRDVTAKYAAAAAAEQLLVQAMGSEVRYSRLLDELARAIPEGVWLTGATWAQTAPGAAPGTAGTPGVGSAPLGAVTLTGTARTHQDVAVWLETLAEQGGYASPYLQSAAEARLGTRVVVNFSISVELTPEALSGRYDEAGS